MIPDIVHNILGFLHSDEDYITLEICSVVFPQLVDRYLYPHITFYTNSTPPTHRLKDGNYIVDPTKFSFTLIDRPYVANYVRSVRIFVQNALASKCLPIISSNLLLLSQLKSITISLNRPLPWTMLDPGFRTALQNTIRLPSIREVEMSNITESLPLDIFDDCKSLEHLRLFGQCTGGELVFMPRLRSFGVERQSNLMMARMVSSMKGNSLHSLSLRLYDPMEFRTLIAACSATLVNLELDHRTTNVGFELSIQVPNFSGLQLPLLEQVIIRAVLDYFRLSLFQPLFSSLPSTRPIRLRLHLRLTTPFYRQWSDLNWSEIAAFLALPVFRHPQAIELCIDKTPGVPPLDEIVSTLKRNSYMKRLLSTGKLITKETVV